MKLTNDEKQILIATWLHGEHIDDMSLVPNSLLEEYGKVVDLLKRGERDLITLAKKSNIGVSQLAEVYGQYVESFYKSIIFNYKRNKAKEELADAVERNAGVREYERIIDTYYQDVSDTHTLEQLNVGDYLRVLDDRATNKIYGTGIRDIDNIVQIRKGELTSVGARPSTGKSAFMLQVAKNIAHKNNGNVLFLPLEMSKGQTIDRIVLSESRDLDGRTLKAGRLNQKQWDTLNVILDIIDQRYHNLTICDYVRNIEELEYVIKEKEFDVIVIDQLQQLTSKGNQFYTVRERFSYMTGNLKRIALENNVAILLACQVSRVGTGQKPTLEHLKESGSIEEDSDNVILLSRDEEKENNWHGGDTRNIVCQIAKQREGATGEVELLFIPNQFTFKSIERHY